MWKFYGDSIRSTSVNVFIKTQPTPSHVLFLLFNMGSSQHFSLQRSSPESGSNIQHGSTFYMLGTCVLMIAKISPRVLLFPVSTKKCQFLDNNFQGYVIKYCGNPGEKAQ